MKKILVSLLVAAMCGTMLVGCGSSESGEAAQEEAQVTTDVSAAEVVTALEAEGYVRMGMRVDDAQAQEMYHLNLEDIVDYGILETGISPGLGTIIVVKAKEGKVEDVKASVETILSDKIGSSFYPDEKEIMENTEVRVDGDLVSLMFFDPSIAETAMAKYEELIK